MGRERDRERKTGIERERGPYPNCTKLSITYQKD